ncbi:hypothetical protein CLFE_044460 [Clostridium felsineum DSM 794]|nr:hypothetical protein CLFE_044460 [Clostridium felsineum DSM 794]
MQIENKIKGYTLSEESYSTSILLFPYKVIELNSLLDNNFTFYNLALHLSLLQISQ